MKIISNVNKKMKKELKKFSHVDFPSQANCQLLINDKKYKAIIECYTISDRRIIINQKFKYCIYGMEIDEELYKQFVGCTDIKINKKKYYSGIVNKSFCRDYKRPDFLNVIVDLFFVEY